jgi:hypothetical protein
MFELFVPVKKVVQLKVEVIADSSGEWVSNQLRFATKELAEAYGSDLSCRWTAVREYRVVEA